MNNLKKYISRRTIIMFATVVMDIKRSMEPAQRYSKIQHPTILAQMFLTILALLTLLGMPLSINAYAIQPTNLF